VRAVDSLLAAEIAVRVAVMPAPHDPDSLIKEQGGEAFRKIVETAPGFFDYYLGRLCSRSDVGTDKGRMEILRGMAQAVQKTRNQVLIDKYAQKTALQLGVGPDAVRAEFQKMAARAMPPPVAGEPEDPGQEDSLAPPLSPPGAVEQWLLRIIFQNEEIIGVAALHLDTTWIQHPTVRQILQARIKAAREETWRDVASFLSAFDDPHARTLVTQAVVDTRSVPSPEVQLKDILLKLRNAYLDRQLAQARNRSSQPGISDEERVSLLREQQHLRAAKLEPLRENLESRT
jgi:DNA primase